MTRDEILQAIEREHSNLVGALAGISDDDLVSRALSEAWTPKDMLAHVAMWYRVAIKFVADYKRDGFPKPLGLKDDAALNAYNQRGADMRRVWTLAQARTEFDAAYRDLRAVVQTLSDTELVKQLPPPWETGANLEYLIASNSYLHEPEHTEQVNRFKEKIR